VTLVVNASEPIPVVVGIDVEPDPRLTDPQRPEPWRGFERLYSFFMELRSQLASPSGTRPQFSWFFRLDPQVAGTYGDPAWPLKHYERQVAGLLAAGDEVGIHTHAYRWAPGGTWIVDEADPEWIDQCLGSSFQAFEAFFHRTCRVHKTGDRWLSNAAVATLEALGARVDLTLEPGVRSPLTSNEVHTGSPIDCTHVSRRAYRPAPNDFRTPDPTGKRRVWMLPLSTCRVPWYMQFPRRLYHRLRPACRAPGDESSHVDGQHHTSSRLSSRGFSRATKSHGSPRSGRRESQSPAGGVPIMQPPLPEVARRGAAKPEDAAEQRCGTSGGGSRGKGGGRGEDA